MNRYTNTEMTDMHFIYGLADGNSLKARRLYIERFPGRNIPDRKLFQNIHQRLHETGALKKMGGPGKPNTVRTVELEENVLDMIEEDPSTSTRKISNTLNRGITSPGTHWNQHYTPARCHLIRLNFRHTLVQLRSYKGARGCNALRPPNLEGLQPCLN
ncbi:uncharacterized protein LOC123675297 [Harmonia axyridis]|uniref:uncharacterized protein LOC123675297 n=1 Tax=Harmonia axyridis TaxID=115357 RepID=UPI001E276699|nr:uncharacterized protein LOC123675297 [Harmonia axyridis]